MRDGDKVWARRESERKAGLYNLICFAKIIRHLYGSELSEGSVAPDSQPGSEAHLPSYLSSHGKAKMGKICKQGGIRPTLKDSFILLFLKVPYQ